MLQRDSPLYIDPYFAVTSTPWLWRFWRHCNSRDFRRGLEAVGNLNRRTLALYDEWRADGVQFEMHRDGLLFVFLSSQALERSFGEFTQLQQLGLSEPLRLDRAGVREMEPRLAASLAGGIWVRQEGHVRPESVCAGLVRRLQELGGEVRTGVEVTGVTRRGSRALALETSTGTVAGEAFVLAAGAWSGRLARRFGFSLPVEAGKGYSVTIGQATAVPARPLYLYEARVGMSPFGQTVRLGGTLELSGINTRLVPGRVAAIRRAASEYLPGSERGATQSEWVGMRPLAPDGLPVIGRAPGWDNLYVATAHGMLGVTLAPVTGWAIAELASGSQSSVDLEPFDPIRFAGSTHGAGRNGTTD
jgi:D-amino-acid dehydrogenase